MPSPAASATEVLAWVLCPAHAFGPEEDAVEALEAIKAELCRRFLAAQAALVRN